MSPARLSCKHFKTIASTSTIILFLSILKAGANPPCQPGYSGNNCKDECGVTYEWPKIRIVGGIKALPHSWPATALVLFTYFYEKNKRTYEEVYECGGTLIDRSTILTAAHCVHHPTVDTPFGEIPVVVNKLQPTYESMFRVYLGLHDKSTLIGGNKIKPSNESISVGVKRIIKHERYDDSQLVNDIALIKLNTEIVLNKAIQLACLPDIASSSKIYPSTSDMNAYAMGWGLQNEDDHTTPDILRNTKLVIYDNSVCSQYFNIRNSQLCAGDLSGARDTCSGDSGGSIYTFDHFKNTKEKYRYVAAGVVSYGNGCGRPGYAAIYTRISAYIDWIYSHL